ncbi:MAG: PIN domain-containing protein [Thermofilaceae archaeon]
MDCRLIIDANLLVDHLVETSAAPTAQLVETLLQMSMEDKVTILLPELVIDIECRRAITRMVIVEHITTEEKLEVLVGILRDIREYFQSFNCVIVQSWDSDILKRASGIYHRLGKEGEKDYWRARHQDLMIWATAEKHNAAILTCDSDFEKLWKKLGKLTVYHIACREKRISAKRLGQLTCPPVEDALVELGIRIEPG